MGRVCCEEGAILEAITRHKRTRDIDEHFVTQRASDMAQWRDRYTYSHGAVSRTVVFLRVRYK